MASHRWDPWRALRERRSTLLLWQPMAGTGGLAEVHADGVEVVVLDPRLDRRERRAVLAHELVHLERSLLPAGTPRAVVVREEHQVRLETTRRLVPPVDLRAFVTARAEVGPVTAELVAEEFDVPCALALEALDALRRQRDDRG